MELRAKMIFQDMSLEEQDDRHKDIEESNEVIITTNHCLNCDKSHRGECEHYTKLSTQLFATKIELNDRINEYKKLAMKNGCET